MITIGIDPGQTTGICIIRDLGELGDKPSDFEVLEALEVSWDERFTIGDVILKRYDQSGAGGPVGNDPPLAQVVSESFNLYPAAAEGQAHIRSSFPSVEVIGIVSYACHLYGLPFSQQPPSIRSRVQVLPQHAEQLRGLIHAKDAYRHARYFFLNLTRQANPHI